MVVVVEGVKILILSLPVILVVRVVVELGKLLHQALLELVAWEILLPPRQAKEAMAVLEYGKLLTMVLAVEEELVLLG
jgi:hypothetical protein